jgi:hypothetical protein
MKRLPFDPEISDVNAASEALPDLRDLLWRYVDEVTSLLEPRPI